jgi:hypothetical protein
MRKVYVSCVVYYGYEAEIPDDLDTTVEGNVLDEVDGQDPVYQALLNTAGAEEVAGEILSVKDEATGEDLCEAGQDWRW